MSFKFNPDSFDGFDAKLAIAFCTVANRLLDEHIKNLPQIYSTITHAILNKVAYGDWGHYPRDGDTVTARAWDIQEIKSPGCEHDPFHDAKGSLSFQYPLQCAKCGKRLVGKWEEAT